MEQLILELMEQHNLERKEALRTVDLVVAYLKEKNPGLKGLIGSAVDGGENGPVHPGSD
jgi:hypothetical protein